MKCRQIYHTWLVWERQWCYLENHWAMMTSWWNTTDSKDSQTYEGVDVHTITTQRNRWIPTTTMGTGTATPPRIYTQLHLQEEHHTTWASKHASPPGVDGKNMVMDQKEGRWPYMITSISEMVLFEPGGVGGIDTLLLCVWHHSGDPGIQATWACTQMIGSFPHITRWILEAWDQGSHWTSILLYIYCWWLNQPNWKICSWKWHQPPTVSRKTWQTY